MYGVESYREILTNFQSNGFVFSSFHNGLEPKQVFLRHDIDFSVDDALEIALVEAELRISSTYFFMMSSNTYNLLSEHSQNIVKSIRKMGHNISLHFDPVLYDDIDSGFDAERRHFENVFQTKIDIVSIHRPGVFLENNNRKLLNCEHTYQDEYFKAIPYISDSAGRDVRVRLKEFAQLEGPLPLHLLIHPIWWSSTTPSCTSALNSWLDRHHEFLVAETRRNCRTFEG